MTFEAFLKRLTMTTFETSVADTRQLKAPFLPELAVFGRSNAGKSSTLNTLFERKGLVKTGKAPGKTAALNFFCVPSVCFLVDLPGYGYAVASKSDREHWKQLIEGYLSADRPMRGAILVTDIRHDLKDSDLTMLDYCQNRGLSVALLLNKADKLSRSQVLQALSRADKTIQERYPALSIHLQSFRNSKDSTLERETLARWLWEKVRT